MTVIIGMNLGQYVLLAADTRVTYYRGVSETPEWQDDNEKILKTTMGLITGMGLVQLLDPVKNQLSVEDPIHTDRIIEIIKQQRAIADRRWPTDPRIREALDHVTCWMFSYVTSSDPQHPTPDTVTLRLAIAHPHNGYQLSLYGAPSGAIGFPHGIEPREAESITKFLNDNIKPMSDWSEFESTVNHNASLAAQIIRYLSEINEGVSPYFQIGVHSLLHGAAVSAISRNDSLFAFNPPAEG